MKIDDIVQEIIDSDSSVTALVGLSGSGKSYMLDHVMLNIRAVCHRPKPREPHEDVDPSARRLGLPGASNMAASELVLRHIETSSPHMRATVHGLWHCLKAETSKQGDILLLDDFGEGWHPTTQKLLFTELEKLASARNIKIIITTHSPDILDHVLCKNVFALGWDKNGARVGARLSEHPDCTLWKSLMRTGEFWFSVGDDWMGDSAIAAHAGPSPGMEPTLHSIEWRHHQAEAIARNLHSIYEEKAPQFNYETRTSSAVSWADVPSKNKNLMIAVALEMLEQGLIEPGSSL